MEKIPGHKLKYYKKLSSTVASVARESSVSTFPALLRPQPNFLHPPIKEKPPPESTRLPRLSIVSKLCATLREFHQRCTLRVGLPCIDSVLAPSLGRKRRREDPYSKHVRYRRPKSQRQLELAQRPVKAPSAILTTTPHPQKPAYQHQRLLSIEKEENFVERKMKREAGDPSLELRRQESLIVDPTINNHISRTLPRKLYTPDGKVVHYVIPCHSDSSFTDLKKTTPEKTTHKMIQVNCESLLKIEIPQVGRNKHRDYPMDCCGWLIILVFLRMNWMRSNQNLNRNQLQKGSPNFRQCLTTNSDNQGQVQCWSESLSRIIW